MMNLRYAKMLAAGAALVGVLLPGPAAASAGADIRMEPAPINRLSLESQQRGVRTFVNYCLNCHSAKFMRYNRLTDLGLTQTQIVDNLMFPTNKIGETMQVAMTTANAKAWFGVPPPDLTVEARVRGAQWLYNYFLAFYRDDSTPSGWNNLLFPNVAMPHVLAELSGSNRLIVTEYKTHEEAQAAALAGKGIVVQGPGQNNTFAVKTLELTSPGTMTPNQYREMVADLVNFLDYMAEPNKNKRVSIGLAVMLYLCLLFGFAYWLKREYWKDVH